MNCNVFISCYNSYSVTKDGKVYSKYEDKYLSSGVKDGYNEVLFSFGTGKNRLVQWFRVDWLVAMRYILNTENYLHIKHKDGNMLNDNVDNLKWVRFCTTDNAVELKGYRGKYIITDTGKVFNNYTGVEMKQRIINGYPHVALRVFDGTVSTQKLYKVHRLVAEYFIDNPLNKEVVNHKDGNKCNSNVDNLEWVSYRENNIHAIKTGLKKTFWNKDRGIALITLVEKYRLSASTIAKMFNVSKGTILSFYQNGYKKFGLKVDNCFVPKKSKYEAELQLPESYKQFIKELLKDNTVLNNDNKESLQCNDQEMNLTQ